MSRFCTYRKEMESTDWGKIGTELALSLLPVLTTVIIAAITLGIAYLRRRNQWMAQTQVDEQVEAMARGVVISLQQSVVDGLKAANADGKLTPEEIALVKQQALNTLQQQLTAGQRQVLATLTGDITTWLSGKIETALAGYKLDVAANTPLAAAVELTNPPAAPTPTAENPAP